MPTQDGQKQGAVVEAKLTTPSTNAMLYPCDSTTSSSHILAGIGFNKVFTYSRNMLENVMPIHVMPASKAAAVVQQ